MGLLALSGMLSLIVIIGAMYFIFNPIADKSGVTTVNDGANPSLLKVHISQEGMYEISVNDVLDMGFNLDDTQLMGAKIFFNGEQQPLWQSGSGEDLRFQFYGQPIDSRYAVNNVYWLVIGTDPPEWLMDAYIAENPANSSIRDQAVLSAPESLSPDAFASLLRIEENKFYKPQVDTDDHWFWISMTAPAQESIEFEITNLVQGAGRLRLTLWADTQAQITPDHHLILKLNGQIVEDTTWDGRGSHLIETDLEPGVLTDGINVIEIVAPGDTGVAADIVYLDEIQIRYPARFTADNDRLGFISQGGTHRIEGLSSTASVYDLTNSPAVKIPYNYEDGKVEFSGSTDHHYWVAGHKGYLAPDLVEPAVLVPDLRHLDGGADYLAIGPSDLLDPLTPLLDLRGEQGLQALAVPLEAIYDQFGAGLPEPDAIRKFLSYAQDNWQLTPRYLLLVGDASYDPKGFITPENANRLPVYLIDTVYGGQTASDVGYAQLGEKDWVPDADSSAGYELAVGRIPAREPEQVSVLVNKIIAYESNITNNNQSHIWHNRVLAVADGQDISFSADAQAFLDLFPKAYQTGLIAPSAGESGVNEWIIDEIDDGNLLVAYFGHGGVSMWGKDRLFTVEDVDKLQNGEKSPVVINMTCLTGLFTHPTAESLAEAMLWKPDGGAIAVLAPTSLTLPNDQSPLIQSFVQIMLDDPTLPLGEMLRRAREDVPGDTKGLRDVTNTFLLFGDPGLRLPLPND